MIRLLVSAVASLVALGTSVNAQSFVVPAPVIPYTADVIDYRPDINAAGTRIVFERQLFDASSGWGAINLYIADLATPYPKRLVRNLSPTTRPDWCRSTTQADADGLIAFSDGNFGPIYVMPPISGRAPQPLKNSQNRIYPTWYPGCGALALYAIGALPAHPQAAGSRPARGPTTLKVDAKTGVFEGAATGQTLWAGFASINQINPLLVAFAGQQFDLNTSIKPCNTSQYNQDCNYVYTAQSTGEGAINVAPIDPPAAQSTTYLPAYQGRAPSWSPDGKWIAFESNRACGSNLGSYSIFLQDWPGRHPARQVTDCKYNAQHAKWYAQTVGGRTLLIVSVLRYPNYAGPPPSSRIAARTISSLDISAFVATAY